MNSALLAGVFEFVCDIGPPLVEGGFIGEVFGGYFHDHLEPLVVVDDDVWVGADSVFA